MISTGRDRMNLNFYMATYKQQYKDGTWRDAGYRDQKVVVLARNIDEAKNKINRCIEKHQSDNYRAVLNGKIRKCIGIEFCQGFEDSFYVVPVQEEL